jgi:hypothetical protein
MIKVGSKVKVIGFGKCDWHNPKYNHYNITGMEGVIININKKLKGGLFNCTIKTVPNPSKEIYMDCFHFCAVKLKEE